MAQATQKLIDALRKSADNLKDGAPYAWGHQGKCNCGNLMQNLTPLTSEEIMRFAQANRTGEWSEMAEEFCPTSNAPADLLVQKLLDAGLSLSDIHHLEYLNDKKVLSYLPNGFRWLNKNIRTDVIEYFEAMANMLEADLFGEHVKTEISQILQEKSLV
ncbi:hypothetical protein AD998_16025 [bacterium 336/3]|nr:hypothetical protein AD998_16025 [bacterium 336/3]